MYHHPVANNHVEHSCWTCILEKSKTSLQFCILVVMSTCLTQQDMGRLKSWGGKDTHIQRLSMRVWLNLWILWILSCMLAEFLSWWTTAQLLLALAPASGPLGSIIFWHSRFDCTQLPLSDYLQSWEHAGHLVQLLLTLVALNTVILELWYLNYLILLVVWRVEVQFHS